MNRQKFIASLLLLTLLLSGCGSKSTVELIEEKKSYPEPQEVISNLEEKNYQVESYESFEDLGINATRIKAVKDDEYLDICYNVLSEDDLDTIIEYYMENYKKYNLISNVDIVFCYSSEIVIENAGLQ